VSRAATAMPGLEAAIKRESGQLLATRIFAATKPETIFRLPTTRSHHEGTEMMMVAKTAETIEYQHCSSLTAHRTVQSAADDAFVHHCSAGYRIAAPLVRARAAITDADWRAVA
jgi:hypothetical protein